jgi:hypothetical protein
MTIETPTSIIIYPPPKKTIEDGLKIKIAFYGIATTTIYKGKYEYIKPHMKWYQFITKISCKH